MTGNGFTRIAGKTAALLAHLLMIAAAGGGIYGWILACRAHSPGDVFLGITFGLPSSMLAGCLFCRLYLPGISAAMVHFLLHPVRRLPQAPPVLSPIEGKITAGRYQEAEAELLALREKHPDHPQLTMMLIHLYSLKLQQERAAFAAGCAYFRHVGNSYAPENVRILMRLADLGTRCGGVPQARAFLQQELASPRYPDVEKKQISARLTMLLDTEQEE